jgi:predicted  nucleic acid-binding Zn-ribbon protein
LEVKEQLLRLLRLQELVLQARAAAELVENAPLRLEEIERRFRERNAEYVEVKERCAAIEADQRQRSGELGTLEEHRKKYMTDLMQVQNQREYAAMLREIDSVKSQITDHEEAILRDMEEAEQLKKDLASRETHIQEERQRVEQERGQVEAEVDEAQRTIQRLTDERVGIEGELPAVLARAVSRLTAGRQGVFLSRAENGVCQSCYVRMRPQVFQEIRQGIEIHACGNCRRLLYHEPSLKAQTGEAAPHPSNVQAVNDGVL